MARTLTTPVVRADATQQAITGLRFEIPHKRNAGNTAMEIDKDNVVAWYEVETFNEDGERIRRERRRVYFADWPAGFKTDMKDVYTKIQSAAETDGVMGAGTDEPLE